MNEKSETNVIIPADMLDGLLQVSLSLLAAVHEDDRNGRLMRDQTLIAAGRLRLWLAEFGYEVEEPQ
jgi:hypothetical protein